MKPTGGSEILRPHPKSNSRSRQWHCAILLVDLQFKLNLSWQIHVGVWMKERRKERGLEQGAREKERIQDITPSRNPNDIQEPTSAPSLT